MTKELGWKWDSKHWHWKL